MWEREDGVWGLKSFKEVYDETKVTVMCYATWNHYRMNGSVSHERTDNTFIKREAEEP